MSLLEARVGWAEQAVLQLQGNLEEAKMKVGLRQRKENPPTPSEVRAELERDVNKSRGREAHRKRWSDAEGKRGGDRTVLH